MFLRAGTRYVWGLGLLGLSVAAEVPVPPCEVSSYHAQPLKHLQGHAELIWLRFRLLGGADSTELAQKFTSDELAAAEVGGALREARETLRAPLFDLYGEWLSSYLEELRAQIDRGADLRALVDADPRVLDLLKYIRSDTVFQLWDNEKTRHDVLRRNRKRTRLALELRAARLDNALKIIPNDDRLANIARLERELSYLGPWTPPTEAPDGLLKERQKRLQDFFGETAPALGD